MSNQQQQYTSLNKYFYIDTKHEPVMPTQTQQTKYKYPILIQPEPVKDILIRITPYKSDYCLN